MAFDFHESFRDPKVFLETVHAWEIVDGEFFSVSNMDENGIQESIISDILAVTMWEKQTGLKIEFNSDVLTRFLNPFFKQQILQAMESPAIAYFIEKSENGELRVKNDTLILQKAMDFCGVFYTGFLFGENVVTVNRDVLPQTVEETEELITFLASVIVTDEESPLANAPSTTKMQ